MPALSLRPAAVAQPTRAPARRTAGRRTAPVALPHAAGTCNLHLVAAAQPAEKEAQRGGASSPAPPVAPAKGRAGSATPKIAAAPPLAPPTQFARAALAAALTAALTMSAASPALAAGSGGRVGGSGGFSAARSAPSRSYAGGGGGGYVSRTAPPLRGGVVAPRSLNGMGMGWGLLPFGGYYGGFGYPPAVAVGGGGGGGGLFTLIIFGIVAFALMSSLANNRANADEEDGVPTGRVTVAKLQVGLLGSARSLQRDLDRIAGKADTSTPSGLHFVLQETVLALLRNPEYAVYGACGTRRLKSLSSGEAAFNEASMDERGKLAEETLVNVGGRARSGPYSKGGGAGGAGGDDDELVVVTLLVAARGGLALPKVTSAGELRAALNRLGSVPSEDVLAVEVLWTPQDPRDKYYRSDAVADYPTLNVL